MASQDTTSEGSGTRPQSTGGSDLQSENGTTTIADSVVAKVAGIATREVGGVYDMGAAAGRALGRMSSGVGLGEQRTQGVSVEVGERQAAVDLTLVVEYGESIVRVAEEVRHNVIRRIEGTTGLEVNEVNITVNDLHFPGDEQEQEPQESRVE
jgi:uncharacterized alkaline shock family protein YloU